jgi:hypothetical protein
LNEVDAFDHLHGEEPEVAFRDKLVERDKVRVRHVGQGAKLFLEPVDGRSVRAQQGLQSDYLVPLAVVDFIHDSHPARADPAADRESLGAEEFTAEAAHANHSHVRSSSNIDLPRFHWQSREGSLPAELQMADAFAGVINPNKF